MSVVSVGGFGEARRGGALWFLLAAVFCGLVAGWIAVRAVAQARHEVPAVLVRRAVAPMTRIRPADVVLTRVPAAALPGGALGAVAAATGRFSRAGLVPGEIVTTAALQGGLPAASAFDERLAALAGRAHCAASGSGGPAPHGAATAACGPVVAMTLAVSAAEGFPLVRTGDRVDVVGAYGIRSGRVVQVVARDIRVLARLAAAQGAGPSPAGAGAQGVGPSSGLLVLALTPKQALRLQFLRAAGKVAVLLEAPGAAREPASLTASVVDAAALTRTVPAGPPAVGGLLPRVGRGRLGVGG